MLKLTQITNRHYQFNSIRLVSSHIITSEKSQKPLFETMSHNCNKEIKDFGKTLQHKEESMFLPEIKTVNRQKDIPDKIVCKQSLEVIEIDSDSEKCSDSKNLEKSEKISIIQKVDKISDDEIELLRQFCCPLCKIRYESTVDIDNHISKFHRIIDKIHRELLVLKSKNY